MFYRLLGLGKLKSQIEDLQQRVEQLESLSHEPQNYREKCEEIEKRVRNLEAHPAIGWRGKNYLE